MNGIFTYWPPPDHVTLVWSGLGHSLWNFHRFHKGYKFLENLNAKENHLDSQTDNIKPVLELKANCNKTFMQRNCQSFQPESFLQYVDDDECCI